MIDQATLLYGPGKRSRSLLKHRLVQCLKRLFLRDGGTAKFDKKPQTRLLILAVLALCMYANKNAIHPLMSGTNTIGLREVGDINITMLT